MKLSLSFQPKQWAGITCLLAMLIFPFLTSAQTVYYVDIDRPDNSGNGLSWATAFKDLQNAINAADDNGANLNEIWVAEGTYLPTESPDNELSGQYKCFNVNDDTGIYGGFAGNELNRNNRDWVNHPTILSGDFLGNDNTTGKGKSLSLNNIAENAYHVLVTVNLTIASTLDGFIIQGGSASDQSGNTYPYRGQTLEFERGGGMYNMNSAISINNCTFQNNYAFGEGGGMFNGLDNTPARVAKNLLNNVSASPTLNNCTFDRNNGFDAGGMFNADTSPTINNCVFTYNHSRDNGGGLYNRNGSGTIINSNFIGNYALLSGGGIYNWLDSSPIMKNSIVWNNLGDLSDPNIKNALNQGAAFSVSYSLIQGSGASGINWNSQIGTDAGGNLDSDPLFIDENDPHGVDDFPRTSDDGLVLSPCSPALNTGTNTGVSSTDILAASRPYNAAITDIGAYELQASNSSNTPSSVSVDKTAICTGSTVVLSGSCTTGTIVWYTQASNGSSIGSGSPLNNSPTSNTTYYAACLSGICESSRIATAEVVLGTILPTVSISGTDNLGCNIDFVLRTANGRGTYFWSDGLGTNATANISSVGTYTVTLTADNACTATATTAVLQNQDIPILAITAFTNPSFCGLSDGTIDFSVLNVENGNYTLTYNRNGSPTSQSISVNSGIFSLLNLNAATYSQFSLNNGSCTGTLNETQVISDPLLTISASNTGPYQEGDLIQLNSTAGTSYTWEGPNAFSASIQDPSIPNSTLVNAGTYSVTVYNGTCFGTATTAVSIESGTARMKYDLIFDGPNPVFITSLIQDMEVQLSDHNMTVRATPLTTLPKIFSAKLQLSGTIQFYNQFYTDSEMPFYLHEVNNVASGPDFVHNYYSFIARGYDQLNANGNVIVGDDVIRFWMIPGSRTIAEPRVSAYSFCIGNSLTVSTLSTGSFKPGNIYNAYLSDENGSFAFPSLIGSSADPANIPCSIPNYLKNGTSYKIMVLSNKPFVSSPATILSLSITSPDVILVSPIDDLANEFKTEKAIHSIRASNTISGNSNIQYQAGKSIALEPGFVSTSGTSFKAEIKDVCTN